MPALPALLLADPLAALPAEPAVTLWHWIGAAGEFAGAAAFGLATRRAGTDYARQSRVTLFFVPLIATALYVAMAMGQGATTVAGERVWWIRYVTWFTTTPLLLNQLARLVHARGSVVWSLLLANQVMIATGAVAELSPMPQAWVWYAISSAAFGFLLATLLGDLSREAAPLPADVRALFRTLVVVNVVTWVAYPVVWALGTKGLEVIAPATQTAGYVLLDLASKVGFGLLILARAPALERSGTFAGLRDLREGRDVLGASPHAAAIRAAAAAGGRTPGAPPPAPLPAPLPTPRAGAADA